MTPDFEEAARIPQFIRQGQIAHLRKLEEEVRDTVTDTYGQHGIAGNLQQQQMQPLDAIATLLVRLPFGDALDMAEEICKTEDYSASKPVELAQALNRWAKSYAAKRR